ncbi:TetR/AcrR family transcriptional regulator [Promicromonospora sukumoe]
MATDVIEQQGTSASLNEIAKRAGVGPGTLYRHFPSREALLAEVLATWVARVQEAAGSAPVRTLDDLVDWLGRLSGIASGYRGLAASMAASMDDETSPLREAHRASLEANTLVFRRAREAGLIDHDVDSGTVARLVTGVAMVAEQGDLPPEQVRDMLRVILDGLIAHSG